MTVGYFHKNPGQLFCCSVNYIKRLTKVLRHLGCIKQKIFVPLLRHTQHDTNMLIQKYDTSADKTHAPLSHIEF